MWLNKWFDYQRLIVIKVLQLLFKELIYSNWYLYDKWKTKFLVSIATYNHCERLAETQKVNKSNKKNVEVHFGLSSKKNKLF